MTTFTALIDMPLPQGTNHGYTIFRHGSRARLGLSDETRNWKEAAAFLLLGQRPPFLDDFLNTRRKQDRDLGLGIVFLSNGMLTYRRDIDGMIKFSQDALATGWKFNDARIRALTASVRPMPEGVSFDEGVFYWLGPKGELPALNMLETMAWIKAMNAKGVYGGEENQ